MIRDSRRSSTSKASMIFEPTNFEWKAFLLEEKTTFCFTLQLSGVLVISSTHQSSPSDEEKISMLSLLIVSVFEVENHETRLISRKRIDHLFPSILSGTLLVNCSMNHYFSFLHDRFHSVNLFNVEDNVSAIFAQSQLVVKEGAFVSACNSRLQDNIYS